MSHRYLDILLQIVLGRQKNILIKVQERFCKQNYYNFSQWLFCLDARKINEDMNKLNR